MKIETKEKLDLLHRHLAKNRIQLDLFNVSIEDPLEGCVLGFSSILPEINKDEYDFALELINKWNNRNYSPIIKAFFTKFNGKKVSTSGFVFELENLTDTIDAFLSQAELDEI